MTDAAHGQAAYAVRLETGPTGAAAVVTGLGADDVAVVVDVLSFTTTLTLAVERGIEVHPFAWRDARAEAYARKHDAVLARRPVRGPSGGRGGRGAVSRWSGRAWRRSRWSRSERSERLETSPPSPRPRCCAATARRGRAAGAALAQRLHGQRAAVRSRVAVVGACLRNASAVADALAPALLRGAALAVVASGERWPDGSLRPAAEDVWGAGALLSALVGRGVTGLSPEAGLALAAWRTVEGDPVAALHGCAGGRELAYAGFADDVEVAAEVDVSQAVPVLRDGALRRVAGTSCGARPGEWCREPSQVTARVVR